MIRKILFAFLPLFILAIAFGFSYKFKLWYPRLGPDEILVFKNEKHPRPIRMNTNRITGSKVKDSMEFLRSFVNEGDLVYDVGANVGLKTDLYLACGASVICFEPQPGCVSILEEKYKENPRVYIEGIGLAAQEGEMDLYLCTEVDALSTFSKEQMEESRFSEHGYKWDNQLKVPVSTLDAMIQKHGKPSYCKIDVENFEYEVIKGLNRAIPYLSFECNTEQWTIGKQCIERLVSLGYDKFNYSVGATDLLLFPRWLSPGEFVRKVEEVLEKKDFSEVWGLWGEVYAQTSDQNPS